jgi:hypothetical protein
VLLDLVRVRVRVRVLLELGFELDANEAELAILRLRVVKRAIDFDELRAWFAIHLRPVERPTT